MLGHGTGRPSTRLPYASPSALTVSRIAKLIPGDFDGSLELGGVTLKSTGSGDAFMIKLDPSGALLWARSFGDAQGAQYGVYLSFDAEGSALLTGSFFSTIDFGGGSLIGGGNADAFLSKLQTPYSLSVAAPARVCAGRQPFTQQGPGAAMTGTQNRRSAVTLKIAPHERLEDRILEIVEHTAAPPEQACWTIEDIDATRPLGLAK